MAHIDWCSFPPFIVLVKGRVPYGTADFFFLSPPPRFKNFSFPLTASFYRMDPEEFKSLMERLSAITLQLIAIGYTLEEVEEIISRRYARRLHASEE